MQNYIRPYHPSDLSALYRICLQTGDSGKDASNQYKDPDLLGQYYAAPYAVLEPDLCFVLLCNRELCGYILGTQDSAKFYELCEKEWFPILRERYPLPKPEDKSAEAHIIRCIHSGHKFNNDLILYQAHLHIDILPQGQGQGMGRKLIETFLNKLRELKVPSVHLRVGETNPGAIKFYERVGFHVIREYDDDVAFGMKLPCMANSSS